MQIFLETTTLSLKTNRREEFIQITNEIKGILKKSSAKTGSAKIFCPHSTAGLTINQNANPDVMRDIGTILHSQITHQHLLNVEGNSDAHFKSTLFGVFLEIPIINGELALGSWQGIFFCEFDGPRTRKIIVEIFGYDG